MEIVICAAVKAADGTVVRGHRHHDALRTLKGIPGLRYEYHHDTQGFVTSLNRFVTRKEGYDIQVAAGIPSALIGTMNEAAAYLHGELYSEDLY
jgi:hypothetical protein